MGANEEFEPLGDRQVEDLEIEAIDWSHGEEHVRTRAERKGTQELNVEPTWATEAALDPHRLARRASENSIEVVGLSRSAPAREGTSVGRVLKVWLVPKNLEHGEWWGASACEAKSRERRKYWQTFVSEEVEGNGEG